MSFEQFYGMKVNTFDKQNISHEDAFISNDHREVVAGLNYLKENQGIGVVTAPCGSGKSYAIRCFMESLNPNLFTTAYISLSTVTILELYKELCIALNLEQKGGKTGMFHNIRSHILQLNNTVRRPLVIVIDEAQYLSRHILKELKMLTNFKYDSKYCFTLILCGEPLLLDTLNLDIHEGLRQRITFHYEFHGFSDDEVREYVYHKLNLAGTSETLIGEDALTALTSFSSGNPRLIDKAMTSALMIGAQHGHAVINADTMKAAIEDLTLA